MKQTVVIVGGGKVGGHLAQMLTDAGHGVTVVEIREERAAALAGVLGPGQAVAGSGADPSVLEAAGIRQATVLAAVTGTDEVNLVVTALGRFAFAVPRTIARVNDPANAWMFAEDMGVDAALDQAELLGHLIAEEMLLGDMRILLELRRGLLSLVEEQVGAGARADGRQIADLDLPSGCVILAVLRDGDVRPAHGGLRLRAGDEVFALVHTDDAPALSAVLA